MRLLSTLVICLSLSVSLANAQAAAPAKGSGTFQPADKLFSVAFPAKPSAQEDSLPSQVGPPYKRMTYVYQGPSSMLMAGVVYTGTTAPPSKAEQADLLEHTVDSIKQGMPDLVPDKGTGITAIAIGGHEGKQIKGLARGAGFYARLFVTARNLFMVQGVYDPHDMKAKASAEAFVESFAITDGDAAH